MDVSQVQKKKLDPGRIVLLQEPIMRLVPLSSGEDQKVGGTGFSALFELQIKVSLVT